MECRSASLSRIGLIATVTLLLLACGGGGSNTRPATSAGDPPSTPSPPSSPGIDAQARLAAQPAFAHVSPAMLWREHKATGQGVRIVVDDDVVDVFEGEFTGRIATDGGEFLYPIFTQDHYNA